MRGMRKYSSIHYLLCRPCSNLARDFDILPLTEGAQNIYHFIQVFLVLAFRQNCKHDQSIIKMIEHDFYLDRRLHSNMHMEAKKTNRIIYGLENSGWVLLCDATGLTR